MKATLICFAPQRTGWRSAGKTPHWGLFWSGFNLARPSPAKQTILFPQLGDLALKIGLGGWLLRIMPVLLNRAAQRQEADTEIGCHLLTRQAARQSYAH
jgi:hypothetical protein